MPASPETVIDAEIRVPDAATAVWIVDQLKALIAERGDSCHLVAYGIYPAAAYDAEGPETLAGVPENGGQS